MKSEYIFVRSHVGHILWTCLVTVLITVCILVVAFEVSVQPVSTGPSILQGIFACTLLALPLVSFWLYFAGSLEGRTRTQLSALAIWLSMGIAYIAFRPVELVLRDHSMAGAERIQKRVVLYHQVNGHYPATIEDAMGDHPPMYAPTLIRRKPFFYEPSTGGIGLKKPLWGHSAWIKRPGRDWHKKSWWGNE